LTIDGFAKGPTSAPCFIFGHADVLYVRPIPQDSHASKLQPFTKPADCDLFARSSWLQHSAIHVPSNLYHRGTMNKQYHLSFAGTVEQKKSVPARHPDPAGIHLRHPFIDKFFLCRDKKLTSRRKASEADETVRRHRT
jgi:hypothetical protein